MPFLPGSHEEESAGVAEFTRAVLESEQARATLLLIVFAAVLFLDQGFMGSLFGRGEMPASMPAPPPGLPAPSQDLAPMLLAALVLYTWVLRLAFRTWQRENRQPLRFVRLATVLVETTVPTVLLLQLGQRFGAEGALDRTPAYLYFLLLMLSTLRLDVGLSLLTGVVTAAEYLALALYYQGESGVTLASFFSPPLSLYAMRGGFFLVGGTVAAFIAVQLRERFLDYVRSQEERGRLRSIFGQHLSPTVVNKLMDQHTEIESETRTVCLMFLDIRDFSQFAEHRSPKEVVDHLNLLFEFMIESINKHQGVINKFLGDGFMAVFGVPLSDTQACQHAVEASFDIIRRLEVLVAAGTIPPTRVGIGLHVGEVVTGTVGSALRKEYTVIGDVVNVAARIEQLNKTFGSQLLISEEVWTAIGRAIPNAAPLDAIQVKGRETPVRVLKLA
jgi:adenylate cyclase